MARRVGPAVSLEAAHARVEHWEDFLRLVEGFDGWAFRGQPCSAMPLLPSLARHLAATAPERALWPLRESRSLRVFRRKAHIYLGHSSALDDDLRCLAMMQHHGAPTRLLDFTKSPFVAAFFALESSRGDAAVWALDTPSLWRLRPEPSPDLDRDTLDPRLPGRFERFFLPNRHRVVWFGEPAEMDERLVAQSGLFVVPGLVDAPLEHHLAAYTSNVSSLLVKVVLPAGVRRQAMRALYRMNITWATLQPGIDGLARSMRQELEHVWPRLVEDFRAQGRAPVQGPSSAP